MKKTTYPFFSLRRLSQNKGANILEYLFLIIIVLYSFYMFRKYVIRGFAGRWKIVGDSMGYGRQYDPDYTEECAFYEIRGHPDGGVWYNVHDFETCWETEMKPTYLNSFSACFKGCIAPDSERTGLCPDVPRTSCEECCDQRFKDINEQACAERNSGIRCGR